MTRTLVLVVLAHGVNAVGAEVAWVPVRANFLYRLGSETDNVGNPTEICVLAGSRVYLEIRLNGWVNAPGSPTLGVAQAELDATGLLGANATPPNPGVDLVPVVGPNGRNDGAYITTKTCHKVSYDPVGYHDCKMPCGVIPATISLSCPPLTESSFCIICLDNPDFVFSRILALGSVSTATPNIVWGGVSSAGQCRSDVPGRSFYLGTLIVDVPTAAEGVYELGFGSSPVRSFLNDCAGNAIPEVTWTPAKIRICKYLGEPDILKRYVIVGQGESMEYSWQIDSPAFDFFNPGAAPVPKGSDESHLAAAFVSDINSVFGVEVAAIDPKIPGSFTVAFEGIKTFELSVGRAGHTPDCVVGPDKPCRYNPTIREIAQSDVADRSVWVIVGVVALLFLGIIMVYARRRTAKAA